MMELALKILELLVAAGPAFSVFVIALLALGVAGLSLYVVLKVAGSRADKDRGK